VIKADEIAQPSSCLNRSREDEPVFVICARDVLAPRMVEMWAEWAERAGVHQGKTTEARQLAKDMREWQNAHGHKIPD
jgi:hypothetical protein